jgi:hypothetical protein
MEQLNNIDWIVKIERTPDVENEIEQRIRIRFNPLLEKIHIFGEAKIKTNRWYVFSEDIHEMVITLEQLQEKMEVVVIKMRERLREYENLAKGFTVLKWIAFEESEE